MKRRDFFKKAILGAAAATVGLGAEGCSKKRTEFTPITLYDDVEDKGLADSFSTRGSTEVDSSYRVLRSDVTHLIDEAASPEYGLLARGRMYAEARNGLERILAIERTYDENLIKRIINREVGKEVFSGDWVIPEWAEQAKRDLDGLNIYPDLVHASKIFEERKGFLPWRNPEPITINYGKAFGDNRINVSLTINKTKFYTDQSTGGEGRAENPKTTEYTLRISDAENIAEPIEFSGTYEFQQGGKVTLKDLVLKEGVKGINTLFSKGRRLYDDTSKENLARLKSSHDLFELTYDLARAVLDKNKEDAKKKEEYMCYAMVVGMHQALALTDLGRYQETIQENSSQNYRKALGIYYELKQMRKELNQLAKEHVNNLTIIYGERTLKVATDEYIGEKILEIQKKLGTK